MACILLVLGMLLSHGGRLAHMFVVEHAVCEHGELTDDVTHSATETASTRRVEAEQALHPRGAPGHGAEHEHCDATSLLHRVEPVPPAIGGAVLLWTQPRLVEPRPAFHAITQLDLAPKASPPRA